MNLYQFSKEVHANAISHGWWDDTYTDAVAIDLIQSEITEAFEEWRADRPLIWHRCKSLAPAELVLCERCPKCHYRDAGRVNDCPDYDPKPEGIATELIDVVLRVLDTAAAWGIGILQDKSLYTVTDAAGNSHVIAELTLPELVRYLHQLTTSLSFYREKKEFDGTMVKMSEMILLIFTWLEAHDIDPEALMMEKHRYNKQRSYKHGGKRC